MKIVVRHIDSGKFIKTDLSRMETEKHPWILVDDINDATNDPGYINGHDLNMEMFFALQGQFEFVDVPEKDEAKLADETVDTLQPSEDVNTSRNKKAILLLGGSIPGELAAKHLKEVGYCKFMKPPVNRTLNEFNFTGKMNQHNHFEGAYFRGGSRKKGGKERWPNRKKI